MRLRESYKMEIDTFSNELHQIFNSLHQYHFPINQKILPANGIYILFENGEKYNSLNRIVRIGTHTGDHRFIKRIEDHFGKENQRNSIFRKHIGRCILRKNNDSYLFSWDLPFKKKEDKIRNKDKVDLKYEGEYEIMITEYIRKNLSFVVIPNIPSEKERLEIESAIIATISQDTITLPSLHWLGKYHPDNKISQGKLWNVHHLMNSIISEDKLFRIKELLRV